MKKLLGVDSGSAHYSFANLQDSFVSLQDFFVVRKVLNRPVNRRESFFFQKGVALAEMAASEKSPVGRQGARMGSPEDQVP